MRARLTVNRPGQKPNFSPPLLPVCQTLAEVIFVSMLIPLGVAENEARRAFGRPGSRSRLPSFAAVLSLGFMVIEKIQELAQLKSSAAKLEATIATQLPAALAALPAQYGFGSLAQFIAALKQAGGKRKAGKTKGEKPGKRKRVKITPAIKAKVKAAVEAGKSGSNIAKKLGISSASVQNVKKELGLVKARAVSMAPTA